MALAEGAPNLRQRLSHLPTAPHVIPLHAESFTRLCCAINTTFNEKIYSRWCCIDRLSWRRLLGTGCSCSRPVGLAMVPFKLRRGISASKMARELVTFSHHAGKFCLKGYRFSRIRVRVDAQRGHGFPWKLLLLIKGFFVGHACFAH